MVKARRGTGAPPPTPTAGVPAAGAAFNPFAGISLTSGLSGGSGNGFAALAQVWGNTSAALLQAWASSTTCSSVAHLRVFLMLQAACVMTVHFVVQAAPATAEAPASQAQQAAAGNVTEEAAPVAAAAPEPEEQAPEPSPATTAPVAAVPTPAASSAAPAFATFASTADPFAATAGTGQLFNFGSAAQSKDGATPGAAAALKCACRLCHSAVTFDMHCLFLTFNRGWLSLQPPTGLAPQLLQLIHQAQERSPLPRARLLAGVSASSLLEAIFQLSKVYSEAAVHRLPTVRAFLAAYVLGQEAEPRQLGPREEPRLSQAHQSLWWGNRTASSRHWQACRQRRRR